MRLIPLAITAVAAVGESGNDGFSQCSRKISMNDTHKKKLVQSMRPDKILQEDQDVQSRRKRHTAGIHLARRAPGVPGDAHNAQSASSQQKRGVNIVNRC